MTTTEVIVRRVSPVLGAEIGGVDLSRPVDDDTFAAIHQAFLDHGVVFFRDQSPIDPDVQIDFARRFGPLHTHPAAPASDPNGAMFVIHTHRDSVIANGNGWHTDVSCDEEPPLATMLQIHDLPKDGGGDTLFASMEAAYAALSPAMRIQLCSLTAMHESEHVYRGRYADRGVDDTDVTYPTTEHPVIRTHPETGRPSIYVNQAFTTRLCGLPPGESAGLFGWLFRHLERPEFQIRFTWRMNDVAMWDNRCVQHYAVWDYWPHERRGNRVSVRGDRPFYKTGGEEPPPSTLRLCEGGLA